MLYQTIAVKRFFREKMETQGQERLALAQENEEYILILNRRVPN